MFVAALIIYFKPEWVIVDPICTFIFSVLVLATTISILKNTMAVIMEASPVCVSYSTVKNTFLNVPGIRTVHNLRIWSLTTDKTALSWWRMGSINNLSSNRQHWLSGKSVLL